MDIISLIIIIAIIKKVIEKNKENNKREHSQGRNTSADWSQQKKRSNADMMEQHSELVRQRELTQQRELAQQRAKTYVDSAKQQRATKERLEKKYGKASSQISYQKSAAPKQDILTRAKENANEEAADTFKQQAHAEVCAEYRCHANASPDLQVHQSQSPECDIEGESDILKRVNDLIVMGYDGNMEFDRDFVAEGVEMLNSFSL